VKWLAARDCDFLTVKSVIVRRLESPDHLVRAFASFPSLPPIAAPLAWVHVARREDGKGPIFAMLASHGEKPAVDGLRKKDRVYFGTQIKLEPTQDDLPILGVSMSRLASSDETFVAHRDARRSVRGESDTLRELRPRLRNARS